MNEDKSLEINFDLSKKDLSVVNLLARIGNLVKELDEFMEELDPKDDKEI